jgi:hypothetical protein
VTIVAAHEERDPLAQELLHAEAMAALARIEGREVCFELLDESVGVGGVGTLFRDCDGHGSSSSGGSGYVITKQSATDAVAPLRCP